MPPRRKRAGRPPGSTKKISDVKNECTFCGGSFRTKTFLVKHLRVCPEKNSVKLQDVSAKKAAFSCRECNKKFRFKQSYTTHVEMQHSKLPGAVSCDQCPVRCPDKKSLIQHIADVHEREIFKCEHCQKEFVRRAHVLRHIAQKGCDGANVSMFPCEICDATFTRKDNLIVHLRLQHINPNHFQCKHCSYHTGNFSKLIIHTQKFHSENPNQFECDHCSKITSSRAAMAKHLEIHGDKKYECDVCGYSTYTIEVIRRHVLTHVQDKPYKCSICGSSYIQRAQLQRHLTKHTGNMCATCGATFKSKACLIIHEREHMGLDKLHCPYETCPFAKKEFSNENSLTNHVKSHLDDRPFECAVCKKKFHNDINMRRHVSTHTLDRPRRCMYCVTARAYVRGEQLVKHVRKCHPDLFRGHLQHVRQVLGTNVNIDRVKKSEMDSILGVLDAESDRILQGYGAGVLYGGVQDADPAAEHPEVPLKTENNTLMSEEDLAESLRRLLTQLIDLEKLECFGWPDESIDVLLEKVIEQCGARAADRERWTRVQRLRENTKQLFLYVIEDANIARMLDTHTIDQIIQHILQQVADTEAAEM
ncbi:zinc finger Y-chromosomal protein-like [Choristoneura fumiferana]|uniref:zinc finger Y-chromosomal protein-like n=1 Tax=Choristoneura fumiferana TaxID=7141 RepID=UPI003D15C6ED